MFSRVAFVKGFTKNLLASDYKYKTAAWLQELARVVKTFKYAKKTSLHIEKTDDLVSNYLIARTSYFKILLTQFWSLVAFKIIITAAMLIVGVYLLLNQQINIGQFIAADIVILAVINSVEKLILTLDKAYDTLTAIEKLDKIDKKFHSAHISPEMLFGLQGFKPLQIYDNPNKKKICKNIYGRR